MAALTRLKLPSELIDLDFVTELIDAIGVDVYCSLIDTLSQEVTFHVGNIEQRAAAGETARVKETAHRLAGLLSQFGAFEVTSAAERLLLANEPKEVLRLAKAMSRLCRASMSAISDLHAA